MKTKPALVKNLSLKHDIRLVYVPSLVIAGLFAGVALAGLTLREVVYPSEEIMLAFLPVDFFHLLVGLPILLISMAMAKRGSLAGLLCWPGILLYLIYSYITNLVGVAFGVLFVPYLLLVTLSVYTLIALVASIDAETVRHRLAGKVPERLCGGVLVILTLLFIAINLVNINSALAANPIDDNQIQIAVWIADFTIVPAMLVGGFGLWRRVPLGYVAGAGSLLTYSLLFIGLIPVMLFPVFYSSSPAPVADISFILTFSLVCIIPFGFFLRGTLLADRS